ncbi:hypothetical protein [Streptomyces spinosirectus]
MFFVYDRSERRVLDHMGGHQHLDHPGGGQDRLRLPVFVQYEQARQPVPGHSLAASMASLSTLG